MSVFKPKLSKVFSPYKKGTTHVLGELQTAVMEVLWDESPLSVTQVEHRLKQKREIAHTTVLTILDRMFGKGFLTRVKKGRAFVYSPRFTKREFEQSVAQEILSTLLSDLSTPALSAFVEIVCEDDEKLKQLETMIRDKREKIAGRTD